MAVEKGETKIHAILMGSYLYFYYEKFLFSLQWHGLDNFELQVPQSYFLKSVRTGVDKK
jgi:hypothetical protein